ncbi:reticulon-4 isoform 1-T1 [Discoglossus pictus]
MEEQSPLVTSSESDRNLWEDPEVLDLTKGAGDHPPFKVAFDPDREEDDREDEEDEKQSWRDSLEPSPEEEEPSSISSAPVIPSAPEQEPEPPAVPPRKPSGSVDENLFTLPAASAPLMHSSADNVLDFQQHPSSISPDQEELASLLLGSTASLPSLSSLSTSSSKDHAEAIAPPKDLNASETFQGSFSSIYTTTTGDFSLAGNLGNVMECDYSEVTTGQKQPSVLGQIKEDVIFSERGYVVEHPTSQQETLSEDHTKLYTQSAKEMFSGMLQSVGPPHEEFSEIKEIHEQQYVDFKPFASTGLFDVGFASKDVADKVKSDVGSLNFETTKETKEMYTEEKEMDLSDDISPVTPEFVQHSSNYDMFVDLGPSIPFTMGASHISGNQTDEKKMAEIEAKSTPLHFGSNVATVNPFFEDVDQGLDYVTTQNVSTISSTQIAKPEGLTPDIVQEAYESEAHDVALPKLGESKIDLVQTAAESVQDKVSPSTQTPALFEDSDSVSSPVLPDIVMEAPLASAAAVALEATHVQPDISPLGNTPVVSEEKIKFESEKPPSYEEAVNKPVSQETDKFSMSVESKKGATVEAEAPYISIACDLIKETIPTESAVPDFTDFSKILKNEFDSQFTQHFDESSPESEHSEPSYKHWEPAVVSKEIHGVEAVSGKDQNTTSEKDLKTDKKSVTTKSYMESFEPEPYSSKNNANVLVEEKLPEIPKKEEKPLQMEAFGKATYSDQVPSSKYSQSMEIQGRSFAEDFSSKAFTVDQGGAVEKAKKPEDLTLKDLSNEKKKQEAFSDIYQDKKKPDKTEEGFYDSEKPNDFGKAVSDARVEDPKPKSDSLVPEKTVAKPVTPTKEADTTIPSAKKEIKEPSVPASSFKNSVVDLLYWRDIKKSGVVFGLSLFLLLSLTVFSIVSVSAYIALALLSVTISFRIYKGVLQAIQKSDEGHPFRTCLDSNVTLSEDLVQKYCNVALGHINCTLKELRRLFLVEDLIDSLKFAVLMWVFTYIGALFNGLTLLILALISLFSIPVIYERHQTQIDHYLGLINKNVKNTSEMILSKIPGLKRKTE